MTWLRKTQQEKNNQEAQSAQAARRKIDAEAQISREIKQKWDALLVLLGSLLTRWQNLQIERLVAETQMFVLKDCAASKIEIRLKGYLITPEGTNWRVENGKVLGVLRDFPSLQACLYALDCHPDEAPLESVSQYLYTTYNFADQPDRLENIAGIAGIKKELEISLTADTFKINGYPVSPLVSLILPADVEIFLDEYLADLIKGRK